VPHHICKNIEKIIVSTSAEICMFIGVLEHLYDLTSTSITVSFDPHQG
jgi:hypothetical protein